MLSAAAKTGCGTVPHCCQGLLIVLHKLTLKGRKEPEGVCQESPQKRWNRELCSISDGNGGGVGERATQTQHQLFVSV